MKSKDISFVLNAFAISLLLMAIMITFAPYADYDHPQIKEIERIEGSLMRIEPGRVPDLLDAKGEKPVMLVLYASWCGYCAQLMPEILELQADGALDGVEPIFLSMDSQPRIFSKYLLSTGYHEHFQPIMLKEVWFNNLPKVLQKLTGSHFKGGIPYVGFFNNDAKMVAEFDGLLDKQAIMNVVTDAIASHNAQ